MSNSKVFFALLTGIAVGSAAGVLLAPYKGAKTRKKILKKGNNILSNIKDKTDEAGEQLKHGYASAKNNFSKAF